MVAIEINPAPALAAAEKFFNGRDFAGARDCLQEVLLSEPATAPVLVALGYTHFQLGDLTSARSPFERAAEIDPQHAPAFVNLALVLDQLGELELAAHYARQAAQLETANSEILRLSARLHFRLQRFVEAAQAYHKILLVQPNDLDALLELGTCLFKAGDPNSAREAFQLILQSDPGHEAARANLAVVERTLAEAEAARVSLRDEQYSLAGVSEEAAAWLNRGFAAVTMNAWPNARDCFQQVLRRIPASHPLARVIADKVDHFQKLTQPPTAQKVVGPRAKLPLITVELCQQEAYSQPWFQQMCRDLKLSAEQFNRKYWEYGFIVRALRERGLLTPASKGLGFGTGREHLVAYFAKHGCEILATDLDHTTAAQRGWVDTNQHSSSVQNLFIEGICDYAEFARLVQFRTVDMNQIPADLMAGQFDFTWSTCSFEHLGSIEHGREFLLNQMRCLKPGGVAVHTTEFNLSSNDATLESGETVLYRRRDIEEIASAIAAEHGIAVSRIELNFDPGSGPVDRYIDVPPYSTHPQLNHLKLLLGNFVCTSIGLLFQKPV
ncbi:MAG: tetratricopeptide repeat protein [Verrucomicrobia bacterium]|nr:tetratricopeptide repeat protein [Verrucomicrobiota bacterium]